MYSFVYLYIYIYICIMMIIVPRFVNRNGWKTRMEIHDQWRFKLENQLYEL